MGTGRVAIVAGVGVVIACAAGGPANAADPSLAETVADLKDLAAPARRLDIRLDVGVAASVPRRGSRAELQVELATRPDYWYAVGVSSSAQPTKTSSVTPSGEMVDTINLSSTDVAFSARVFKRIGALVLSGGVINSRAGVGIELRGWQDRARVELLVTDDQPWSSSRTSLLAVRAGASLQWRWFYAQAGVQDLDDRDLRAGYFGVGMRWTDPDLRYLIPWLAAAR